MHRPIAEIKAEIAGQEKRAQQYEGKQYPPNSYTGWIFAKTCSESLDKELRAAIIANTPTDDLETLCTAWADGRVVVLPVKVGDTVKVRSDTWGNVWNYKTVESGNFLIGEIVSITKTKKQTLMKIQAAHNVSWKRPRKRYTVNALGITVFPLTAAALQEGQG